MGDLLILSILRPVIWAIYFVESLIFSGALNRRSLLLRLELMDCSHSKKTLIGFEEMNFTLFLKIKVSFFLQPFDQDTHFIGGVIILPYLL
jgi:hypothetical protein